MNSAKRIFIHNQRGDARGSMLVELLLTIALVVLMLPFIFRYQMRATTRAQNIATLQQMEVVQTALERYIVANREDLLSTVGRNIIRLRLSDLIEYGVPDDLATNRDDAYQLRVLKSNDFNNRATLQGVVVLSDEKISPLRTREIVNMGGQSMGFVDGTRAYGAYGAWRTNTVDLGLNNSDGIIGTTSVTRDNAKYLWRVPSDNASDATMMSPLSLGGHNITDMSFFDVRAAVFNETLTLGKMTANNVIFKNRTSLDKVFFSTTTTVAGGLSSDGKSMDISGTLSLSDTAKFSSFTTGDLYVTNMTLGGISIDTSDNVVSLKINQALDMTTGRIDAMFVTVGFAGSITPRLQVRERIEDSSNPEFFWDGKLRQANWFDVMLFELRDMAPMALSKYRGGNTDASRIFGAVAANKNATVADYMNAITEIQNKVRQKYRLLNLE